MSLFRCRENSSKSRGYFIRVRKWDRHASRPSHKRQDPSNRYNLPGKRQSDIPVSLEAVSVVKEKILAFDVFQVQLGVLASQKDLVPEDHLVHGVALGGIFCRQIKEELLDVPVESLLQIRGDVECDEAQVALFPGSSEVFHFFEQDPGDVQAHGRVPVFEGGGEDAAQGERRHDAQREGEQRVGPGQQGIHLAGSICGSLHAGSTSARSLAGSARACSWLRGPSAFLWLARNAGRAHVSLERAPPTMPPLPSPAPSQ